MIKKTGGKRKKAQRAGNSIDYFNSPKGLLVLIISFLLTASCIIWMSLSFFTLWQYSPTLINCFYTKKFFALIGQQEAQPVLECMSTDDSLTNTTLIERIGYILLIYSIPGLIAISSGFLANISTTWWYTVGGCNCIFAIVFAGFVLIGPALGLGW